MTRLAADHDPDLGTCCRCRGSRRVHTIACLNYLAAVPGHGWGCVVCDAPANGAMAVLCDRCALEVSRLMDQGCEPIERYLVEACRGRPGSEGREPIGETVLRPAFDHDRSRHAELETADN